MNRRIFKHINQRQRQTRFIQHMKSSVSLSPAEVKVMIGIDTGVNTGFAMAIDYGQGQGGELQQVSCLTITQAMSRTLEIAKDYGHGNLQIFIEDARLRTWFTGGREKAQGVGSVKRDAQIWEDWCKENQIQYEMVHPKNNCTKYKADTFAKLTGWTGRTNEHARDAAMLVFKRTYTILMG